jgi:cation diffusion facilitator CzcD-associated flavoprotein CzcO
LGLKVKVYEKGTGPGGTWYWNCYPGARVDSPSPIYQFFDKDLYEKYTFKEKYPGWAELRNYFNFIETEWDLRKDIEYNKFVENATFNEQRNQWLVETSDNTLTLCKWFIPCLGFAARKFMPNIPGLSSFKGDVYHTGNWPHYGVNMKGKKVSIIGTGASGIQVIQTIGPVVESLNVYQRTPNYCLPMNQGKLDPEEQKKLKASGYYEEQFKNAYNTFAGFGYDFSTKNTFDDSPEEREAFYDKLFLEEGGFEFWLATYKDMLFDQKANDEAYRYWRKRVLARVPDPEKQRLLAPEKAPHPFGTKRPSLEQNIYEIFSQPNVKIIDVNENPVVEITPEGIKTKDGVVREVDTIVFATGFDSVTGGLAQVNIVGTDGRNIADHWKDGCVTAMGIAIPHFPNMFFLYGPQAPTAFANGPSCVQVQADWIESTLVDLEKKGVKRIEPKQEVADEWRVRNQESWDKSLFPLAKSWYQGSNIPGKKVEPLNW